MRRRRVILKFELQLAGGRRILQRCVKHGELGERAQWECTGGISTARRTVGTVATPLCTQPHSTAHRPEESSRWEQRDRDPLAQPHRVRPRTALVIVFAGKLSALRSCSPGVCDRTVSAHSAPEALFYFPSFLPCLLLAVQTIAFAHRTPWPAAGPSSRRRHQDGQRAAQPQPQPQPLDALLHMQLRPPLQPLAPLPAHHLARMLPLAAAAALLSSPHPLLLPAAAAVVWI